jgi:hypothetical protein
MEDHRVRQDCTQCHRLMDPIGFALEPFDGIGVRRTHDEGQPIDAATSTFDNTTVDGPNELREWLVSKYSDLFVTVSVEKLMTYALGRGMEHQDMPLIRRIARDAVAQDAKFSALVLGVVKSAPFQMSMNVQGPSAAQTASAARPHTEKGNP